jgi:hypothetical protein
MWEPPQRGDRGRKRVSSFQDSTLTQENDGLTPIADMERPLSSAENAARFSVATNVESIGSFPSGKRICFQQQEKCSKRFFVTT